MNDMFSRAVNDSKGNHPQHPGLKKFFVLKSACLDQIRKFSFLWYVILLKYRQTLDDTREVQVLLKCRVFKIDCRFSESKTELCAKAIIGMSHVVYN